MIELQQKYAKMSNSTFGDVDRSTPLRLVKGINNSYIPLSTLKNPKSKFLDIGAGMGTFSTVLFQQLLEFHDKDHILDNMIYLVEIKEYKCEYLKLLGFKNIYNNNFLTHDFKNMKFDVVLGNPPYNKTKASAISRNSKSLYIPFVEKAMKLSTKYVILVIPHTWMISKKQETKDLRENMINFGISSIEHTELGIFGKDNNVNPVIVKLEKGKKGNFIYSRPYVEGKEVLTSKPHSIKPDLNQGFFPQIFDKLSETLASNIRLNNNNLKPHKGSVILPGRYRGDAQGKEVYLNHKQGITLIDEKLYKTSEHVNNFRVAYAYLTGMGPLLKNQLIRDVKVVPPGVEISSQNKYISCKTKEEANNLYEYLTSKEVNTMLKCIDRGSSLENWMINSLPPPPNN